MKGARGSSSAAASVRSAPAAPVPAAGAIKLEAWQYERVAAAEREHAHEGAVLRARAAASDARRRAVFLECGLDASVVYAINPETLTAEPAPAAEGGARG